MIPPSFPDWLLGNNTQKAITVGVGHGFIGIVNELISRSWQMLGARTPVILTGGWARSIHPHLPFDVTFEPTVTLDGLRYAFEYHVGRREA